MQEGTKDNNQLFYFTKLVIYLGWQKDQRRCQQDMIMDSNSELSSRMVRIYIDYTT